MNEIDETCIRLEDVIESLHVLLTLRNVEEIEHLDHVYLLSMTIARRLGMSGRRMKNLGYACSLHDIGKLGVHGAVLAKAAKLTEGEMAMMKKHTEFADRIIRPLRIDPDISKIVLQHHENWDGTGYPKGLRGEEIMLEARILRLADFYDALRTNRPYRQGFPHNDVVSIVKHNTEKFDPAVVEAFMKVDFAHLW